MQASLVNREVIIDESVCLHTGFNCYLCQISIYATKKTSVIKLILLYAFCFTKIIHNVLAYLTVKLINILIILQNNYLSKLKYGIEIICIFRVIRI
jgi:hypothetical protein